MEKTDFKKTMKSLYSATAKIKHVEPGEGTFLAVDGQGAPGGEEFQNAIQQLYSVAYTLKFSLKNAGVTDFTVAPLETLWYDSPTDVPDVSKWHWKAMIRVPETVTDEQVEVAQKAVTEKNGTDTSDVRLQTLMEGDCLQVMHVGPYDEVGQVYEQLYVAAMAEGATVAAPGHEVYLSDPRRTAPEKLKTIVRMSIAS